MEHSPRPAQRRLYPRGDAARPGRRAFGRRAGICLDRFSVRAGRWRRNTADTAVAAGQAHQHGTGRIASRWPAHRHLTANFAAEEARRGRSAELGTPPPLPDPTECADPRSFMREAGIAGGIADRIEYRLAATPGW